MRRKLKPLPRRFVSLYPTPRPKKERHFPWFLVRWVFLLGLFFGLVYLLFLSPLFTIEKIVMTEEANEIEGLVSQVKGKNLWLIDKHSLQTRLAQKPEVQSVRIKRRPPHTLLIELTLRPEGIVWESQGKKYLLDNRGVAIKEIAKSQLPQVVDLRNVPVELNQQVVNPLFVYFVKNLNLKFTPKTGLPLKALTVAGETTFDLVVQTEGFSIIFDTQGDLDQQLENLVRVYQAKKDEIHEYIDLRIEGRVYYK